MYSPYLPFSTHTCNLYLIIAPEFLALSKLWLPLMLCATALREQVRTEVGRDPQPSPAIINSQSAKTTEVCDEEHGFDSEKRVKDRKRHSLALEHGSGIGCGSEAARMLSARDNLPLDAG